jgi:tetratricopeptide (TPR) repeat protein
MDFSMFESDELLALAKEDLRSKNYQLSLKKIKHVLSGGDSSSEAHILAGRIYSELGLFERAKASYQAYLAAYPGAYPELFELAIIERDMGRYDCALEIMTEILLIKPFYPEALFYRGDICFQLGRLDEAKDCLRTLLETAPDHCEYLALADDMLKQLVFF